MEFREFTAGQDDDNRRIDRILKHIFKNTPDVRYFEALRKKLIKVNGMKVTQDYHIHTGDIISIASFLLGQGTPPVQAHDSADAPPSLSTVFQNEHIRLISKPYGIPVQPSAGSSVSIAQIIAREQGSPTDSIAFTPAPLHRLDTFTTGLLAISGSMEGARWFSAAMQTHLMQKTYLGIVDGNLEAAQQWKDPIVENCADNRSFHTVRIAEGGGIAETEAVPLTQGVFNGRKVTLVQFRIGTGRKHQIRAQSAYHGIPLIGDSAYGGTPLPKLAGMSPAAFFLHAYRLDFPADNPVGLPQTVSAPLPEHFNNFMSSALLNRSDTLIL